MGVFLETHQRLGPKNRASPFPQHMWCFKPQQPLCKFPHRFSPNSRSQERNSKQEPRAPDPETTPVGPVGFNMSAKATPICEGNQGTPALMFQSLCGKVFLHDGYLPVTRGTAAPGCHRLRCSSSAMTRTRASEAISEAHIRNPEP